MTDTAAFFDMQTAPMRIGTVRLKVRDLETVADFYRRVLGLATIESRDNRVVLGSGTSPLLELEGDARLARRDRRQAGLFHTAFLMSTRADLARWVAHAAATRVPVQGASDHIVSEALYLADPEGNGIEVYADRPVARWRDASGEVRMATEALDLQDLLRSAGGDEWQGFPASGSIGHVHLQVGDTEAADRFYRDVLGFDIAARYPGASFYGSGGYHHNLAGNVWNSRRAGQRPDGMAGLDSVGIILRDAARLDDVDARAEAAGLPVERSHGALSLRDPWGTRITLTT
jgi:catechol 2,3-dioxygenase